MYLEREGIAGGVATYGKLFMDIPKEHWDKIKNRELMVTKTRTDYFEKYPILGTGNVKIKKTSRLKDFCKTNADDSGYFECYTLEDIPRNIIIRDQTCIPVGVYPVTLFDEGRFGVGCPAIDNVPNYKGIRIHAGASYNWTSGCVLVGFERYEKYEKDGTGGVNAGMLSTKAAEIIIWNLIGNLINIGNSLRIDIRFTFEPEEQLPVKLSPTAIDVTKTHTNVSNGMKVVTNADNFQSIGEAGDCGCYSLSELDPNLKGDYATQNTKKFFDKTAQLVYDLVKDKVSINSYTSGSIITGATTIPVIQDMTNYVYAIPTKDDLVLKLEEYTHGKRLDIKSKENVVGTVSFDKSFTRTMTYEGEYIFDPLDTAVERKYGLSFNHDRVELELNNVKKIKDLSLSTARTIYKNKYWEPFELSSLNNQDVADLMFDIFVSCGIEWGQKVIRKAIRDNYGVQAPDATTWHEFMVVAKYVESSKFVGELLEARINYHKAFLLSNPEAVKYYDEWINRCEDYRVEILTEDVEGENTKYFIQIFKAIDDWLKNGQADSTNIYKGVHFLYNSSKAVQSFIPPQIYQKVDFPFVNEWGKVCQMKIDAKTDWAIDRDALMESQWKVVAECMEKALNQNIIPTTTALGVAVSGQFSGSVTTLLIWSKP